MTRNTIVAIAAVVAAFSGWIMYAVENGRVSDLRSARTALDARIAEFEARAVAAESALEKSESSLAASEARLGALRDRESTLDAAAADLRARLATAEEDLEEGRQSLLQAQQEVDLATTRIEELEAALVAAKSEARNVRSEFAALAARSERLEADLNARIIDLENDLQVVGDRNESLTSALDDAEAARRDLEEQRQALAARLSAAERSVASARDAFELRSEQLERARLTIAERGSVISDLEERLAAGGTDLEAELDRTRQLLNALNREHEDLKAELIAERSRRIDVSESLQEKREVIEDAVSGLEAARSERARVEAALDDARSRAERTIELEAQLQQADAEIVERSKRLDAERARAEALERELTELNQRRDELVQQLRARESLVSQLSEEKDEARRQVQSLREEIAKVVETRDAQVREIREQVTLVRMDSDIVFDSGSTRLRQAGRAVLDSVADFAAGNPDRIVSLEGHTDSVPIGVDRQFVYPSNWELSAARAASAARYLQSRGVPPERLRIVGYGPYRPVNDNGTRDGRRANRRLEIVLAPRNALEEVMEAVR